jgi:DNA-binding CsgD family transcriptional regulator
MSPGVVGREPELASLRDFASRIPAGAVALVLEGEAGVGKTTLWEAGLAEVTGDGCRVLSARPAESETALSFSGIGDLLDPVLEEALASLSAAQNRALSRALVLGDDDGQPPDPHAIGVALLSALRALAAERSLVVAVDDVQWLDTASTAGLAYAVRRLRAEPVGLLLSRRSSLESPLLGELVRAWPSERVSTVEVGPLDAGALHQVVRTHLAVTLPRPVLAEVREASAGNPFYALEIVRTMQRSGVSPEGGQPLPVPESLQELVHGRLLALPPHCRSFLLAAAAHAHPTVAITEAASAVGRDAGLRPALDARVVELEHGRIRFTHPLLASGAYEIAEPARRAEVHARLAELLDDPEARAWQLAAAIESPDASVAEALEDASRHAALRGALRPAALMLERASELTPSAGHDDALRRAVDAAYLHFASGDSRRAEAQLEAIVEPLGAGAERARALVILARIRLYEAPEEAGRLFGQVVDEATDDPRTLALAHEGAAACRLWLFERFDEVLHHSELALAVADELGDEPLAADVLMTRLSGEVLLGRGSATTTAERAAALQDATADRRVLDQPLASLTEFWKWTDEHERARAALVDLLQHAHDMGDENGPPWLLFLLGDAERLLGRLETALGRACDGMEAAEQSGQPLFARHNLALSSLVYAQLGRRESAVETAERVLDRSRDNYPSLLAGEALGHLALALGTPEEAVAQLEPRLAFVRREAIVEPGATRLAVDLVEALIELGRREEALELLDWYEGNARRLGRASALANSSRCRGLLAAQAGDADTALAAYADALASHDRADIPLDRGRTLLALGAAQRRANRRRDARATLTDAAGLFDGIGAALWAERARAELQRISGRAPTEGALTPAEERVAALVTDGKTNGEVAAALFLSDRTVEGHLSRIYAKLRIRHRAELAGALAARQSQGVDESNTGDSPVSADRVAP